MQRWLALAALAACVALGAVARAGVGAAGRCAAAKNRAAMNKMVRQLRCYQLAVVRGAPVDPACLAAAGAEFDRAMSKAEGAGGCAVTNDIVHIRSVASSCVGAIVDATPATTTTTSTIPPTCANGGIPPGNACAVGPGYPGFCAGIRSEGIFHCGGARPVCFKDHPVADRATCLSDDDCLPGDVCVAYLATYCGSPPVNGLIFNRCALQVAE